AQKRSGGRKMVNNWTQPTYLNEKNYLDRAASARSGVVTVNPEDILCFHTDVDDTGKPLIGANQYLINFHRVSIPPVNAFWSMTIYDARQHLVLTSGPHNTPGTHNRLRLSSDNSLTIHIQQQWPGMTEDSNWLPAPKDAFSLVLRMYWPKADALNGIWRPPLVMRSN